MFQKFQNNRGIIVQRVFSPIRKLPFELMDGCSSAALYIVTQDLAQISEEENFDSGKPVSLVLCSHY